MVFQSREGGGKEAGGAGQVDSSSAQEQLAKAALLAHQERSGGRWAEPGRFSDLIPQASQLRAVVFPVS